MACLIAVVVAFIIVFAVKKHKAGGISSDSPEYALYKNTRFQECYNNASVSANTDCTAVENRLNNGRSSGFEENNVAYINTDTLYDGDNYDISWEWCEMISCFSNFKIVPSKPRPLAIWPTLLTTWGPVALYIVGSIFQFVRQQKGVYSKKKKACKGLKEISVLDWGVHAYDLASIVWWWYSFGRLVANPSHESTPIPVGWVTIWKYAGMIRFHPYSCASRKNPRKIKIARGVLYFLAAAQWIAACYILHINWPVYGRRTPNPSYDCVLAEIDAAPGTSSCTAEKICSRNWLFVDEGFRLGSERNDALLGFLILFGTLTLAALWPLLMVAILPIMRSKGDTDPDSKARRILSWGDVGPVVSICVCSFFGIIVGAMLISELVKRLDATPDAEVNFDWECKAVHVSLSSWRYYVDVDYEKGLRFAKMWFNS